MKFFGEELIYDVVLLGVSLGKSRGIMDKSDTPYIPVVYSMTSEQLISVMILIPKPAHISIKSITLMAPTFDRLAW